jgi:hypothetical protein
MAAGQEAPVSGCVTRDRKSVACHGLMFYFNHSHQKGNAMLLKLMVSALVGLPLVFAATAGIATKAAAVGVCHRTMPDCDDKTGVAKRRCQMARAQNEANCQAQGKYGRKKGKGRIYRKCKGYDVDSASPTSEEDCE